ncbi:MAG: hypothetical protein D6715_13315 [Calditrichaeota bacterium]|nr:MAG: hypothetical protein D6715_13315 [Calditrichota bacterium]
MRLIIRSNWGYATYTEMMELEAYGTPVGTADTRGSVSGVYSTNYNLLKLIQTGHRVEGCYDWG